MKLSELIEKYGDCEVTDELIEMLKPKGDWIPKMNDKYWEIDSCGEVVYELWDNSSYDHFMLGKRNVYQTEEEAQFALDMYHFCKERSFEPDWEDDNQKKYFLSSGEKVVVADYWYSYRHFLPFYYPTKEAAQEIINKYSFEELEKYYGRV